MKVSIPRGTFDLTYDSMRMRQEILNNIFKLAQGYGFEEIQTPIFERTELFKRSVGDETDIVSKEMYTFEDKKGRSLTLRPELTAPVVRSYIENKLYATDPQFKGYYYGPAFRYERPQKGRFRQFHQFGVESFGTRSPYHDAELITLAYSILKHFNLTEHTTLKINSLGQEEDRKKYIEILKNYLKQNENEMCDVCKTRVEKKTLRVLDCKKCQDKEFMINVPKITDNLSTESKEYFDKVLKMLDDINIKYELDHKLVRGLDYYNDTVFEFEFDNGAAQNSILGGGRYDTLVEKLNGPETPAFGFGVGVERLIDAIIMCNPGIEQSYKKVADIYYMPLVEKGQQIAIKSMARMRFEGVRCMSLGEVKSLKANFKAAEKVDAVYGIIIGEKEVENGVVTVRNLLTREEEQINISDFEDEIISSGGH